MFGFIPGPELCCARASAVYRAHFCGLCNRLRMDYGLWARWLINRDSAFLSLLGHGLQAEAPRGTAATCCNPMAEPKSLCQDGDVQSYVAAVTISGLVQKVEDDLDDERGWRRWLARAGDGCLGFAHGRAAGLLHGLDFPVQSVRAGLARSTHSQSGLVDAAESTAVAYGAILSHLGRIAGAEDQCGSLGVVGRELGFMIYAQDALDDWAADARRGRFNPLSGLVDPVARRELAGTAMQGSWQRMNDAFGRLKLLRHRDLLESMLIHGTAGRVAAVMGAEPPPVPPKSPFPSKQPPLKYKGPSCWQRCKGCCEMERNRCNDWWRRSDSNHCSCRLCDCCSDCLCNTRACNCCDVCRHCDTGCDCPCDCH
jgi:Family of unknown function (DUF5685)